MWENISQYKVSRQILHNQLVPKIIYVVLEIALIYKVIKSISGEYFKYLSIELAKQVVSRNDATCVTLMTYVDVYLNDFVVCICMCY